MNYDNADENFVTKDIYIASSLVALGYKLGFLTKKGSIFYFNFIPRNKDDEGFFSWAESTYWDDGLKVSPKKLFTAIKELKARMKSHQEEL